MMKKAESDSSVNKFPVAKPTPVKPTAGSVIPAKPGSEISRQRGVTKQESMEAQEVANLPD